MSFFQKPRVHTLSDWLELATGKLAAPAKERIKVEIEAHYTDAVGGHLKNDLSESAAQVAALAELGDASAAARRFRRRHLTEWEAQMVKWSEKEGRSIFLLVLNCVIFAEFVFDQLPLARNALVHYRHPSICLSVEFLMLIALPTTCFIVARWSRGKPNPRTLVLIQPVTGFMPGLVLHQLFMPQVSAIQLWLLIPISLRVLIGVVLTLRVWNKLGRAEETWTQAPPPDIATV